MTSGTIVKLVKTHGSAWGKIQIDGTSREAFFNVASMAEDAEFSELAEGQAVDFQEEHDRVNGTYAANLLLHGAAEANTQTKSDDR